MMSAYLIFKKLSYGEPSRHYDTNFIEEDTRSYLTGYDFRISDATSWRGGGGRRETREHGLKNIDSKKG